MAQDEVSEYCSCVQRGRDWCQKLNSFETTPSSFGRLADLYEIESGPSRALENMTYYAMLQDFHTDDMQLTYYELRSRGQSLYDDAIYSNRVLAKEGILLCYENYKDRDTNPVNQRLWASECIWKMYKIATEKEGVLVDRLCMIFQHHIVNEPTLRLIWWAAELSAATRSRRNGWAVYTKSDDGFYAILGSVLGSNVIRMLVAHKEEIRYRAVERVVVLRLGDDYRIKDLEDKKKARAFYIELSAHRELPPPPPPPSKPKLKEQKPKDLSDRPRWRF